MRTSSRRGIRALGGLGAAALALGLAVGKAENRLALVVGNDAYQNIAPLEKASADANAYADALRQQGYAVREHADLTFVQFNAALARFIEQIQPGDKAVFVYSGHGWSDGATNYMVGVDAPASAGQDELAGITIPLQNGVTGVLDKMEKRGAQLRVAIIDACRNNPFKPPAGGRNLSYSRGLAPLAQPPSGTFVVFSASAGETALDRLNAADTNPNSVFTRVFLPFLKQKMSLQDAIKASQAEVVALANGADHSQKPAYYDEVVGPACLAEPCRGQPAPASSPEARLSPSKPAPEPSGEIAMPAKAPRLYRVRPEVSEGIQNVRAGPGVNHPLLFAIPAGVGGVAMGECRPPDRGGGHYDWCLVTWRGRQGWASSNGFTPEVGRP